MSSHFRLRIYRDDDVTLLAEVSTDPAHARPYLKSPGTYDEAEIDLLRGRASIGQINLEVLDKRTDPADQGTGWFTALLSTAGGHSALIGRRAELARLGPGSPQLVMDGVIGDVELGASYVTYQLTLRDVRERGRRTKIFQSAVRRDGAGRIVQAPTILPRGYLAGYGRLHGDLPLPPAFRYLVPPTRPLRAVFRRMHDRHASFDLQPYHWTRSDRPAYMLEAKQRRLQPGARGADVVITPAMLDVLRASEQPDGRARRVFTQVEIWWRSAGSSEEWTRIERPEQPWAGITPLQSGPHDGSMPVAVAGASYRPERAGDVEVAAAYEIHVPHYESSPPLPQQVGQEVDLLLVYTGPPTEQYPLPIEGTFGEVLAELYDAAGIRYDAAAVAALAEPLRARITEPVDDLREWEEEHVYAPLGAAPVIDAAGRIAPVRYALPPIDAALTQLDDSNCRPVPGWSHTGRDTVNQVRVRYHRDFRVPAELDPKGERSAGDGIATQEVDVERRVEESVALVGERSLELKPDTLRALGGADGRPLSGDATDELGFQLAMQRSYQALDRFVLGGQHFLVHARRSQTAHLEVGDWVLLATSWTPEYATGKRGANRLAQIVAARSLDPAWRELRLVDAGPAHQPVGQPVLGDLAVGADGVLSVQVLEPPAGGEAAVQYAISETPPPHDSPLWTFLGRTDAPAVLTSPALPAGVDVWVRARGEAAGRRPSAWTVATPRQVPAVPRVWGVKISLDEDRVPSVAWEHNALAAGMRLYFAIHTPESEPAFGAPIQTDAAARLQVLPAVLQAGEALSVELEPWTGWTGSGTSGAPGERVRTRIVADAVEPPFGSLQLSVDSETGVPSFSFAGTPSAASFAWKASKSGHATDPSGATIVDEPRGQVVAPQPIADYGETVYLTGWFHSGPAGTGVRGAPVYARAARVRIGDDIARLSGNNVWSGTNRFNAHVGINAAPDPQHRLRVQGSARISDLVDDHLRRYPSLAQADRAPTSGDSARDGTLWAHTGEVGGGGAGRMQLAPIGGTPQSVDLLQIGGGLTISGGIATLDLDGRFRRLGEQVPWAEVEPPPAGLFDGRYLRLTGGTLTGNLVAPNITDGTDPYATVRDSSRAPASGDALRDGALWAHTGEVGGGGGGGPVVWSDIQDPPATATRWPTLAEVGAAAASHNHDGRYLRASGGYEGAGGDRPSHAPSGFYTGFVTNDGSNYPGTYGGLFGYGNSSSGHSYAYQIFKPVSAAADRLYARFGVGGDSWSEWVEIADRAWANGRFALLGHTHSFAQISGTVATSQIPGVVARTDQPNVFTHADGQAVRSSRDAHAAEPARRRYLTLENTITYGQAQVGLCLRNRHGSGELTLNDGGSLSLRVGDTGDGNHPARLTIDASGSVGIGTSPAQTLDVGGSFGINGTEVVTASRVLQGVTINASDLDRGTLADARLSDNIARLNAQNVFTDYPVVEGPSPTSWAFVSRPTGQAGSADFAVRVGGRMEWGAGGATRDTRLYRQGPGHLRTDGVFTVGGNVGIGTTSPRAALEVNGDTVNGHNHRVAHIIPSTGTPSGSAAEGTLWAQHA